MKKCADVLVELKSDNSRLFKEAIIIREMEFGNDILFKGIQYALDKLITFGVKEVPVKKEFKGKSEVDWLDFEDLLNSLIDRKLTGNAAREAIKDFMNKVSEHEWNNWYRLILIKDLKCGVSETTINNCATKIKNDLYKVPVFSCQLAQDSKKRKITGKKIIDVKLDGVRLLTVLNLDGTVEQFTRNGKLVENFDVIRNQFKNVIDKITEPMVFDGEVVSENFQNLMKNIFRETEVNTKNDVLYLFDMIPLKDFKSGRFGAKQINRMENLHHAIKTSENLDNIKVLNYDIIDFDDEYDKTVFNEINKKAIRMGYEGVMIKDINASYETKRTTSWLKLKPTITFDLTIIGYEEGTGKYEGMLGSIICDGSEDGKRILVNVGSGFCDDDRSIIWNRRNDMISKIVEIEADAITQNQNGTYSLRFPRFVRFRGVDDHEKM